LAGGPFLQPEDAAAVDALLNTDVYSRPDSVPDVVVSMAQVVLDDKAEA
jgi:hypothetical protein